MLLISNVTAVTMDSRRRVIRDAAVAIDGDQISAVDKSSVLEARHPDAELLDGEGMLAVPGLIDTHAHTPQALLRSAADDVGWRPYLERFIWPMQGVFGPREALASIQLTMLEMVKSGTTCFVDPLMQSAYKVDALAQAVVDSGMRAILAKSVMDQASLVEQRGAIDPRMIETEEQSLAAALDAIKNWNGAGDDRLRIWFGPRVPREPATACSPGFYSKVSRLAADHGVGITVHLAGEKDDLAFFAREYGQTPVEFAAANGLLGSNVLLAMAVWVAEPEVPRLAETCTGVAHCPSANMKLASGIAKVPAMRSAGVAVGLGCDSGANNNCYDMVREMKAASLLQSVALGHADALTAEDALEMATIEGARAIGWSDQIGSLEPGKQADVVLIRQREAHSMPCLDPIANLVYANHGGDVDSVLVAGRLLMRGRHVLTLNEDAILDEAAELATAVVERSGVAVATSWPVS